MGKRLSFTLVMYLVTERGLCNVMHQEAPCIDDPIPCSEASNYCGDRRVQNSCRSTCDTCLYAACFDNAISCSEVSKSCGDRLVQNYCRSTCDTCLYTPCLDNAIPCSEFSNSCGDRLVQNYCRHTCQTCLHTPCFDYPIPCSEVSSTACVNTPVRNYCQYKCNSCFYNKSTTVPSTTKTALTSPTTTAATTSTTSETTLTGGTTEMTTNTTGHMSRHTGTHVAVTYAGVAVFIVVLFISLTVIIIAYRKGRLRRLSQWLKGPRHPHMSPNGATNVCYNNEDVLSCPTDTGTSNLGLNSEGGVSCEYDTVDINEDGYYSHATYTDYNRLGDRYALQNPITESSGIYNKLGGDTSVMDNPDSTDYNTIAHAQSKAGTLNETLRDQTARPCPDEYSKVNKNTRGNTSSTATNENQFVLEPEPDFRSLSSEHNDDANDNNTYSVVDDDEVESRDGIVPKASMLPSTGTYNQLGDVTMAGTDQDASDYSHLRYN